MFIPSNRQIVNCLQSRTLLLEPKKPVKIGRAIARTKVSDNNAIFDCKVLSRNHAELWYEEGKFYLKVSKLVVQPVDVKQRFFLGHWQQ